VRRLPLVYATRSAAREAARLLATGQVLETAVAASIAEGRVRIAAGTATIDVGDGLRVTAVRRPGAIRPRPRAWLVLRIERTATGRGGWSAVPSAPSQNDHQGGL
jgi:hypothetical protein